MSAPHANVAYSYVHYSWWSHLRRPRYGDVDKRAHHTRPTQACAPPAAVDSPRHGAGLTLRRRTHAYNCAPFATEPGRGLSVGMHALLRKLQPFYTRTENADILLRLVHKKATARHAPSVHMRNFAWFCTHYAHDYTPRALLNVHGKAMYPPAVLNALHRSFTRESMDAHCREDRRTGRCGGVLFHWRGVTVRTTVAQLNYVHWMVVTGVYASLLRCRVEVAAHSKHGGAPRAKASTAASAADAVLFVETGAGAQLVLRGHKRAEWRTAAPHDAAAAPWTAAHAPTIAPCNKVA